MAKAASKKKKAKKVLSATEKAFLKLQSDHRNAVRTVFRAAGFHRVTGVSDKDFTFDNQQTDIDDLFVFENIIVVAEYTCAQSSGVGEHLKKKKVIFDKIIADNSAFVDAIKTKFPEAVSQIPNKYHKSQMILKIIYCSRHDFDENYKINVPGPIYMDYPAVRYFVAVSDAIKRSSRFEFIHFLNIDNANVGSNGKIAVSTGSQDYQGSILPEAHSNFDDGYKVVSFYADAEALLKTAYVLRKDGWRDSLNLYQRMVSKTKIESIRVYLKKQKRVFINNIIVTLPSDVHPLNSEKQTIDTSLLTDTAPVTIKLPDRANSVGVIDGQHRIFAYHETTIDDPEIAQLRVQQNLLVTGIIYPPNVTDLDREKFEARLFLEINSTQTNAKAQLKQAIGLVLDPFAGESIAARVLSGLAKSGPLAGFVQQYFFDVSKLKTASIVSYGLKPLVKASGTDSIFSIWNDPAKSGVSDGSNGEALNTYIAFCVSQINIVLGAVRRNLTSSRWTTDNKIKNRVLATTYVNSFLISMRILIENGKSLCAEDLAKGFEGLDSFDFSAYHSSQYGRMAEKIVEAHFP